MKCGKCGKSFEVEDDAQVYTHAKLLEESTEFKSTQTAERYKIRQDIDCKSKHVIYLVSCKKCGFQEVESCTKLSQSFKLRHKY